MEVADYSFVMNIENNGDSKNIMIKAVKRRDIVGGDESVIIGIRHPFISPSSFSLVDDINENCAVSTPIYVNKRMTNYIAQI